MVFLWLLSDIFTVALLGEKKGRQISCPDAHKCRGYGRKLGIRRVVQCGWMPAEEENMEHDATKKIVIESPDEVAAFLGGVPLDKSRKANAAKERKACPDSEGLGFWGNKGFTVGYVDEVNGPNSAEMPEFVTFSISGSGRDALVTVNDLALSSLPRASALESTDLNRLRTSF